MALRIAIGGFQHESHSFAPRPATYADFLRPGGYPPMQRGAGLIAALRGTAVPIAGAIAAAEQAGAALVPLSWCLASPAGPIQDEAFERIAAILCAELSTALDEAALDGVYLDLHGAALADGFPDAEGELLRRVRRIVGPGVPVTASLDPHANLTAQMVRESDALVPFRTYPHVDMKEAGAQALHLLLDRIVRGTEYAKSFRQLDVLLPIGSQCTLMPPMQDIMARRAALAAGVKELGFCFGFPYADFADCGPAIAAYAETQDAADRAAAALLAEVTAKEPAFRLDVVPAALAVAEAIRIAAVATRPVVIADTQDNPGGGGHADTTGLLAELVGQGAQGDVRGAVFCLINDAESAAACHRAGPGATVALSLGGKSDGMPLPIEAQVLRLTDGQFLLTGPMGAGNPANLGLTALIELSAGVRVIVVSRKMQALDQAILRHVGIEPERCPIIVLKSSVHFRADFAAIAEQIIVAAAPGPVIADPSTLSFRHLRPGLRLRPG